MIPLIIKSTLAHDHNIENITTVLTKAKYYSTASRLSLPPPPPPPPPPSLTEDIKTHFQEYIEQLLQSVLPLNQMKLHNYLHTNLYNLSLSKS